MDFSQKWLEKAVCKLFGKAEIEDFDLARIKYLSIGESFDNNFFIEASLEQPPKPFVDIEGGDEWLVCLRGEDIAKLVEKFKDSPSTVRIFMFGLTRRDEDWIKYVCSREAKQLWSDFSKSLLRERYYEKHDNDDEFEAWYDEVAQNTWHDVTLFTGVEVLRISGLEFPDFSFLESFPNLRAAEFVETAFHSTRGIETLNKLEQLSCYFN